MNSFDDFVRDNVQKSSIDLSRAKTEAWGQMSLDLSEQSHIDLILTQADGKLSGLGNLTCANHTEQVKATGSLQGNKLSLEIITLKEVLYRLGLAKDGNALLGDYNRIDPQGSTLKGIANGRWET